MGKKTNSNFDASRFQPNAPHLESLLYDTQAQQPPHNPYYTPLNNNNYQPSSSSTAYPSPPPYTDFATSVPLSHMDTNQTGRQQHYYPRMSNPASVVVHQIPLVTYNSKMNDRKKFGLNVIFIAIMIILLSQVSLYLSNKRQCVNYVVVKYGDKIFSYDEVQNFHNTITTYGLVLLVFGVLKCLMTTCGSGLATFLVSIAALFGAICSLIEAYMTFWTPCFIGIEKIVGDLFKTVISLVDNRDITPSMQLHNRRNVFQTIDDDHFGVAIFSIDAGVFILFLTTFFSTCC